MPAGQDDGFAALFQGMRSCRLGQDIVCGDAVDQVGGGRDVLLRARAQQYADRQAQGVYADVNVGSEAARTAKRLAVGSPLLRSAPAAWG